jgi:signal transduction histidine kinase
MSRYLNASDSDFASLNNKAKIEKHIDKISESVKNLTTILNKFLALGNIEKGEIPIKYSRFDIKKTLESQTSLFQQICKPGQKINYSHKGEVTKVFLDVYLLKNILNNLLSNAIKFSPENTDIQFTSIVHKNEIQLIVSDEGIGIPAAEQKFIFRRFYRAKNALSFQEGTGLGLNIVVKYVELMEGNVAMESIENVGTTFRVTFKNVKKTK